MPETTARQLDARHLRFCSTPRQRDILEAYLETGVINEVARRMGAKRQTIQQTLTRIEDLAIRRGFDPELENTRIASRNYMVKGHSTLDRVAPDGQREMVLQWTKTTVDQEAMMAAIDAAMEEAARALSPLDPVELYKPLDLVSSQMMNLLTISDYHMGMAARAAETGADWNLDEAYRLLIAATVNLLRRAPRARVLVINIQGDFLHFDGHRPVTPTHGHLLDASGTYHYMSQVVIAVLKEVVRLGLLTHEEVHIIMCQGNHDISSMSMLQHVFDVLYENEPRVTVNRSMTPYYVYEFGEVMLGVHHGHLKPKGQLPLLFATRYAEMWGRTRRRYAHCGHRHHRDEKEHPGMLVVQHPTLAPPDKHANDGGWDSERMLWLITYHEEFGECGRTIFVPEMVDLKLAA